MFLDIAEKLIWQHWVDVYPPTVSSSALLCVGPTRKIPTRNTEFFYDATKSIQCPYIFTAGSHQHTRWHYSVRGTLTEHCRFLKSVWTPEGIDHTWRSPVVLGPPADLVVLPVLLLQPCDERLEVLHERLGAHLGLTRDHGHGFRPRLTVTEPHHIPAGGDSQSRDQEEEDEGFVVENAVVCTFSHKARQVRMEFSHTAFEFTLVLFI